MSKERREYPRITDTAAIKWRVADDRPPDAGEPALQTNISGGGIQFQSFDYVAHDAMLALELTLPGFPSKIIALARVTWCEPADDPRSALIRLTDTALGNKRPAYEVGCEFHWVGWESTAAQEAVMSYVKDKLDS